MLALRFDRCIRVVLVYFGCWCYVLMYVAHVPFLPSLSSSPIPYSLLLLLLCRPTLYSESLFPDPLLPTPYSYSYLPLLISYSLLHTSYSYSLLPTHYSLLRTSYSYSNGLLPTPTPTPDSLRLLRILLLLQINYYECS